MNKPCVLISTNFIETYPKQPPKEQGRSGCLEQVDYSEKILGCEIYKW